MARSELFGNRGFLRLWSAATVSNFGTMLHVIALPFVAVIWLDAKPADMAGLAAAGILPGVALGLVAGAWIDRLPRRPILIATDWGRALAVLSVPALAWGGWLRMEHLYAVALVTGLLGFVFEVAHVAYLPSLVKPDQLVEANSRLKAAEAATEGGAFSLGGWLVQLVSAPAVLVLDAVSFVASALLLRGIQAPEPTRRASNEGVSLMHEVREGVVFTFRHPLLLPILGSSALGALSFRMAGVVYLLFVYAELGFPAGTLGMIFAIGAGSSFVGALVAMRAADRFGLGPAMIGGLALLGASILLLPLAPSAGWQAALLLIAHQLGDGFDVIYEVSQTSVRQAVTPSRVLGRVNASQRFADALAMLIGVALGGILGETLGLRATLAAAGAVPLIGALWLLSSPIRRVRRIDPSGS
jgi:MFS family permease